MVPFGWSAGDIKDAIQFSTRLYTALQEAGRTNSDFLEAADFLDSLKIAFEHLRKYTLEHPGDLYSKEIYDLIRQIDRPWRKFRDFLSPYEDSLGINSTKSRIAKAPRLVLWTLVAKEMRQLKASIGQPSQAITFLLLLQLLDKMEALPLQQSQQLLCAMHVAPIPLELEKKLDELKQAVHGSRISQESHLRSLNIRAPPLQQGHVGHALLLSTTILVILLLIAVTYFT